MPTIHRTARLTALLATGLVTMLSGCGSDGSGGGSAAPVASAPAPVASAPAPASPPSPPPPVVGVTPVTVATFVEPWALAPLPDGRLLLSERHGELVGPVIAPGKLELVTPMGGVTDLSAALPVNNGILDIKLDPTFQQTGLFYFSYIDPDPTAPRRARAISATPT